MTRPAVFYGALAVALLVAAFALFPGRAAAETNLRIPEDRSQSTTGPQPPPGIEPKVERVFPPGRAVVTIPGVPGYEWRHGCGPTALGMVIGYYDILGMGDLIPGDASSQTPEVDQAIASQGDAGHPAHYEDYSLPIDDFVSGIIPDMSEPPAGDEHEDDCIADFMLTSRSAIGNYYGWSFGAHVDDGFVGYIESVNSDYIPLVIEYEMPSGQLTWEVLVNEIDAGRPMVFLVDTDGDGSTDHFVTVVGYSDDTVQDYACLDTWWPPEVLRWCEFAPMAPGQPWGVWKGWALLPDQVYYVDAGGSAGFVDIQDAIDAVVGAGRIRVHAGTYAGARNRDLDFNGKQIVLESVSGPDSTIIDCQGLGRGFDFHSGETTDCVVDGFTISDGAGSVGGGFRCFWNSSPTLRNIVIDGCTATTDGGGLWAGAGSEPELRDVTIAGCSAARGGGIHCNAASPTLDGVTMWGNSAGDGGGLSCAATASPVIRRTIIARSTSGGAVYCDGADTPSMTHSCMYGNAGGDSICGSHHENLFVNPLFCDEYAGDFALRDDSQCLPDNNPWTELIGAHAQGGCPTGVVDAGDFTEGLSLCPASPNPARSTARMAFELPSDSRVTISIFDVAGRRVRTLAEGVPHSAGRHTAEWDGRTSEGAPAASGVYFYSIEAGSERLAGRLVLLR
jgi:hypothetical protein